MTCILAPPKSLSLVEAQAPLRQNSGLLPLAEKLEAKHSTVESKSVPPVKAKLTCGKMLDCWVEMLVEKIKNLRGERISNSFICFDKIEDNWPLTNYIKIHVSKWLILSRLYSIAETQACSDTFFDDSQTTSAPASRAPQLVSANATFYRGNLRQTTSPDWTQIILPIILNFLNIWLLRGVQLLENIPLVFIFGMIEPKIK